MHRKCQCQRLYQHAEVRYELEKRFDFWKLWHLTSYMNIEIFRCCTFFKVFGLQLFWYFGPKHTQCCKFWLQMRNRNIFTHVAKSQKYIFLPNRHIIVRMNLNIEFFCCCAFFQGFFKVFFDISELFKTQNEQNWTEHKIMRFLHILYWLL